MDEKTSEGTMGQEASGSESPGQGQSQERHSGADEILHELGRLGDALARAAQSAWDSEQRKQVEKDLSQGLTALVSSLEKSLTEFSRSEQAQELKEQAEKAVEKVRSSKVTAELKEGLTKGLRSVADEMQKVAGEMEKRSQAQSATAPAADEAQDIPVESGDEDEAA